MFFTEEKGAISMCYHENPDRDQPLNLVYFVIGGPNTDKMRLIEEAVRNSDDVCAGFKLILGHYRGEAGRYPKKIYSDISRPLCINVRVDQCVREGPVTDGYLIQGKISEVPPRYRQYFTDDQLWQFEPIMRAGMPVAVSYGVFHDLPCGSLLLNDEQPHSELVFPVQAGRAVNRIYEKGHRNFYEVK